MELFDVTVPLRDGMVHYAGNPEIRITRAQSLAEGASANITRLDLGAHSATHVDAPLHFLADGDAAHSLPLDAMIGPADVVDGTGIDEGPIDESALRHLEIPEDTERLLLKTRNSGLWASDEFTRDFVRLDGSGARYVIGLGARLVGIDYLSIGDADAHRELLSQGVVALEGLNLGEVEPGRYELVCLPLKIVGSDGAPARVVLIRGRR